MNSLNDSIGEEAEEVAEEVAKEGAKQIGEEATGIEGDTLEEGVSTTEKLSKLLKTKSPEDKTVDDYLNHSLNIPEDRGVARALRGLEGFLGDLDLAIVDIVAGLGEFLNNQKEEQKEKKLDKTELEEMAESQEG